MHAPGHLVASCSSRKLGQEMTMTEDGVQILQRFGARDVAETAKSGLRAR
jgi:hypothetical protein